MFFSYLIIFFLLFDQTGPPNSINQICSEAEFPMIWEHQMQLGQLFGLRLWRRERNEKPQNCHECKLQSMVLRGSRLSALCQGQIYTVYIYIIYIYHVFIYRYIHNMYLSIYIYIYIYVYIYRQMQFQHTSCDELITSTTLWMIVAWYFTPKKDVSAVKCTSNCTCR